MKKLLFLGLAVIVIVGGFVLLGPKRDSGNEASSTPQAKMFKLVIAERKLTSGPETLRVRQGDKVMITITSDEDEELHLHGYDTSVDLVKDQPATLSITADKSGHFPYELEHSKTDIGALEVSPR